MGFFACLLCFSFGHVACGILVPQPGIELEPPGVKAQNPNHWTTRKFPGNKSLNLCSLILTQDVKI